MAQNRTIILDPLGEVRQVVLEPVPRLEDLNGKVLGLFDNGKPNGDIFLKRVEELLQERYQIPEIIRGTKPSVKAMAPKAALETFQRADFVISGMGD